MLRLWPPFCYAGNNSSWLARLELTANESGRTSMQRESKQVAFDIWYAISLLLTGLMSQQFIINKFPVQPYFNFQIFLFLTCIMRSNKLYAWHSGKQFRFMSIMYWKSGDCVVFKSELRTTFLFTKQIKFNRQNYLNRNVLSCIKYYYIVDKFIDFYTCPITQRG